MICRFERGALVVGSDSRAHLVAQGPFRPVSTPPVETAIKELRPTACLTYSDEGHTCLCIIFRDGLAWCYDLATGGWHERAEGDGLGLWDVSAS